MAQGTGHTQSSANGGPKKTVSEARTSASWWANTLLNDMRN